MRAVTTLFVACLCAATAVACGSTTLTPEQIVPAFIAASQSDTRTMHMEWQGTMDQLSGGDQGSGLGQLSQGFTGTFDFNGADYAGDLNTTVARIGQSNAVSYARVSGVYFSNYANTGWQTTNLVGGIPPEIDPMRGLTAADVVYEAADTLDGRPVHRLRVTDAIGALTGTLFPEGPLTDTSVIPGGRSDFVIYVDATGIPVGAQMALDAHISNLDPNSSSSEISWSFQFDYTFSQWGEPVTISAPHITNGGGGGTKGGGAPPPIVQPSL